jgi:hypothetical protein
VDAAGYVILDVRYYEMSDSMFPWLMKSTGFWVVTPCSSERRRLCSSWYEIAEYDTRSFKLQQQEHETLKGLSDIDLQGIPWDRSSIDVWETQKQQTTRRHHKGHSSQRGFCAVLSVYTLCVTTIPVYIGHLRLHVPQKLLRLHDDVTTQNTTSWINFCITYVFRPCP